MQLEIRPLARRSAARCSFARKVGIASLFVSLLSMTGCATKPRPAEISDIAVKHLELVDSSRPTKPAFNFPGSSNRTLDTIVWYPANSHAGPFPLIVYSHGTYGAPDNAMHIVEYLVRHGYVVAAPAFPLTSRAAYTHLPAADVTDAPNQPADVSFIITQLLADKDLAKKIDTHAIGVTGHSLGAITSYFLTFGASTRDPRITATALLAGGDPVSANASFHLGFTDTDVARMHTPILFLSADKDVFANLSGARFAAYARVGTPKYELMIHDGVHVYFRDPYPNEKRDDGKNPDCTFFEKNMSGTKIPGCEAPDTFIPRERQQDITRDALLTFFDAYLKHDSKSLARLRSLGDIYQDTELKAEY
jgi:predicted dienelactone hydrolase